MPLSASCETVKNFVKTRLLFSSFVAASHCWIILALNSGGESGTVLSLSAALHSLAL